MSDPARKRQPASLKRIAVWLAGALIFAIGGYWLKTGIDASASLADPSFRTAWYGGALVLLGLAVMLYSRFGLR